jgi:hypothetical protein
MSGSRAKVDPGRERCTIVFAAMLSSKTIGMGELGRRISIDLSFKSGDSLLR